MNTFSFNIIIFLFGCFSIAKECTLFNINHCAWDNVNQRTDCYFNKKIVNCLADIEECPTDELQEKLIEQKNSSQERVNYCPGLEDGICYFNKLYPCEKNIPWDILYLNTLSDTKKQLQCSEFKSKADSIKQCMKDVKAACTAEHILQEIDSSIAHTELIEKICGF